MANNEKGNPPAALEPQVVKNLLDLLTTDDDFRELFGRDAEAALVQAGYRAPAESGLGSSMVELSAPSAGSCLQLQDGASLASKDAIIRDRVKLEKVLNAVQHFDSASQFQAD